jgi:parallel beta-helix repeat protein
VHSLSERTVLGLVFLCLVSSILISNAQTEPPNAISINPDGTVSNTDLIQRRGNLYTLTDSLYKTPIIVQCNDIVLDGAGFILKGPTGWVSGLCAINLTCSNVTVRNFNIIGFWEVGILGAYNGNHVRGNNITKTDRAVSIYADDYNVEGNYLADNHVGVRIVGKNITVTQNWIVNNSEGFFITNSTSNLITANRIEKNGMAINTDYGGVQLYHNNFINQTIGSGGSWSSVVLLTAYFTGASNTTLKPDWDNGYPSGGNYWSDYKSNYPLAAEIEDSGIGDTQYVIGTPAAINSSKINTYIVMAIDRYPILSPFDIPQPTIPISSPVPTPTNAPPETTPTSTPTETPQQTNNDIIGTIILVTTFTVPICVMIYLILKRH